ncbi:MAG TPA: hypothetical protein VEC37_13705, partial [Bacillota bacterium]|nr:hypothetical protein [Bacillota bacterium]
MDKKINHNRKWLSKLSLLIMCGVLGAFAISQGIKAASVADAVTFSMSRQNVTLVNGPTWVTGKSGDAVNLDGSNDYVSLPSG